MKHFKILLSYLILIITLFPQLTYAADNDEIHLELLKEGTDDYNEIKQLENELIDLTEGNLEVLGKEPLPEGYQLPIEKALKVYTAKNLLSLDSDSPFEIEKALRSSDYYWKLRFNVNGATIHSTIDKGAAVNESAIPDMTPELINEIKSFEGKWKIYHVGGFEQEDDCAQIIQETLDSINYDASNCRILAWSGLKQAYGPVALVFKESEPVLLIPLYELKIEGTDEQIASLKPKNAKKNDNVYLFSEIKKAVNEMPTEPPVQTINEEDIPQGDGARYIKLSSADKPVTEKNADENIIKLLPIWVYIISGIVIFAVIAIGFLFTIKSKKSTK